MLWHVPHLVNDNFTGTLIVTFVNMGGVCRKHREYRRHHGLAKIIPHNKFKYNDKNLC